MNNRFAARVAAAVMIAAGLPGLALAQGAWTPGSEIVGQPIQVTTNGITNTLYLDAGGTARIVTPGGNTLPATWTGTGGQLCLNNGSAQECWPYNAPFQPNQPQTLTSSCNSATTFVAAATNQGPAQVKGERGR